MYLLLKWNFLSKYKEQNIFISFIYQLTGTAHELQNYLQNGTDVKIPNQTSVAVNLTSLIPVLTCGSSLNQKS